MSPRVLGVVVISAVIAGPAPVSHLHAQSPAQRTPRDTLAIEHATVIPMDRDVALLDHTVLVWEDRIVWVGPSHDARVPRAARRVDGRGAYLIPGLADMHVHLDSVSHLAHYIAAGVTTVRNMNGRPVHLAWRDSVAKGTLVGPSIFTAGPPCCRGLLPWWPNSTFAPGRTMSAVESLVRQQKDAGYDMIKVIYGLPVERYQRLMETARAAQIPVVGHVLSKVGLARSLAAGQVSLEHANGLFGEDERRLDEHAHVIARSGAWVGTIVSSRTGGCEPPSGKIRRSVASLRRANVKFLAGSDAGIGPVPAGSGLHCELASLVAAGLTPYESLASATANAGAFAREHLTREKIPFGTVTVGARADLLLLRADPRADIGALANSVGVVLRGLWQPHEATRTRAESLF